MAKSRSKRVYIITSGRYSPYTIRAVFSTRTQARVYMSRMQHIIRDDMKIAAWELDKPKDEWVSTIIRMDKLGQVREKWQEVAAYDPDGTLFDTQGNIVCAVLTDDTDLAIKVANERRITILAEGLWGNTKQIAQRFKGVE